jgi:AraC-like DNA-binding protein
MTKGKLYDYGSLFRPEVVNSSAYIKEGVVVDISEQLYNRMSELNWSTDHVADVSGLSRTKVARMLTGHSAYDLVSLYRIAKALNIQITIGEKPEEGRRQ